MFRILLALLMTASYLEANSRTLGFANRRADQVENKRVEKQLWAQPKGSRMMDKTFPIKEWNKHFSSLGAKRAPISVDDTKDKKLFRTEKLDRKNFNVKMSRWNERMADLHKRAGIELDQRAQLIADRQFYNMMLQDTRQFSSMAEEVSLRDLNRYQFRRNRSDDSVPVERAGAGQ